MNRRKKRKSLSYLLVLLVIGCLLGAFVAFGPPGLYAKSETPEYCASCHVMDSQYEAWFHSGAHRRSKCVDCHLPNDRAARHLFWKGVDGMKDALVFHSGRVPETIRLSPHGAKIVLENCQRCHAETIARINEDRQCWDCHRRLSHKRTGAILTQTP
jgi:cytochrome c nitrite reductase small subunit